MSFSTGGLFFNESLRVLDCYLIERDWARVRELILSENLLQSRTQSSAARRAREICHRLEKLTEKQLNLLSSGNTQEQLYLLWVAICKYYPFIKEFSVNVLREKFLRMDLLLTPQDYDVFFEEKAEWHDELEQLTASTRAKLRQVLFKMMREAEIISKDNMILPGLLTKELATTLVADNPAWFTVLPVTDAEINKSVQLSVVSNQNNIGNPVKL
ncbi:MAG: hypothetical protein A2511_09945 [Deltaproteobacteria bacterium RIFOXYD12_FULL_50_9]|nr:MAG: hypothetical protein A2511_09945 [Deltaproteobacteria bacterium RIFOXYD12_FULL_50_9]